MKPGSDASAECAVDLLESLLRWRWPVKGVSAEPTRVGRVSIRCRGDEVASHGETTGRRQRVMDAARLAGIGRPRFAVIEPPAELALALAEPELLRPLSESERAAGDDWS